jgi:putative transposase
MVTPAQRRELAAWAAAAYQLSERKACRAAKVARSLVRYRSRKPSQEPLRRRLRELASVRVHCGYQRLHVYLRREGWKINHKRVYRLYTQEGLPLRRRRTRHRRSAVARTLRPTASLPNEQWAVDFMHDTLADGRTIRVLTTIDVHTRECLALVPASGFSGAQVAEILTGLEHERGRLRNGSASITGPNSRRGRSMLGPTGTGSCWTIRGRGSQSTMLTWRPLTPRSEECLSQHWFRDLEEARGLLGAWKLEYNEDRPHGSLGHVSPAQYRAGETLNSAQIEGPNSRS